MIQEMEQRLQLHERSARSLARWAALPRELEARKIERVTLLRAAASSCAGVDLASGNP